ncbi:MAG: 50S ribosomal protein L6 [Candidatus Nomurabacteria bacterium]|nr:MAG: 50S ribosomal protein L6 [Candidatus Nomurabacteria bacterium]
MSRIGKLPIAIPDGVTVTLTPELITVKGPKGELQQALLAKVQVTQENGAVQVSVKDPNEKQQRSLWGLYQRLISNMIIGVTKGFTKQLEINGVGYQAVMKGKNLVLSVGFSHPVEFPIPDDLIATAEKNQITISGSDKQRVGEIAAQIRRIRKPEPYKGKGIKYSDEIIRRKAGKQAKAGA